MNFSNWFSTFTHILTFVYCCVTPLLLITWCFVKKYRIIIHQFIAISNGWFGIKNIIGLAHLGREVFYAWYGQNQHDGYSFYYVRTDVFSPYGFAFWLQILTIPVSILFLFRKFRRSIWMTVIIVVCVLISSERFILLITSLYRDYLPSSWSIVQAQHWWESDVFSIFLYLLIITSTYYFQQRRKRISRPLQS